MDQQRYQYTVIPVGYIKQAVLEFSAVTGLFTVALDVTLPSIRRYSHHTIINTTDVSIDVRLDDSGDIYTCLSNVLGIVFDDIFVETTISIKATSALPTTGQVQLIVW